MGNQTEGKGVQEEYPTSRSEEEERDRPGDIMQRVTSEKRSVVRTGMDSDQEECW